MDSGENKPTRGQKTRNALLSGVLDLVEQGIAFSAISLREVTRQAGVVPTSFYRHFENMDELGLNLVDQTGLSLRKQMREIRSQATPRAPHSQLSQFSIEALTEHADLNTISSFVRQIWQAESFAADF